MRRRIALLTLLAVSLAAPFAASVVGVEQQATGWLSTWTLTSEIPAREANQAAAADEQFVYAIDNSVVARYDRNTGKRISVSTGEAKHLNSGFLHEGRLYCAHSNYPSKPERSEIKVLDLKSMELTNFKDFGNYDGGSLTWAIFEDGHWWCNFAFYGDDNGKTFLAKFGPNWEEVARYTYPPEVIAQIKRYSLSGGVWRDGSLLVTDHDHRVLYELRLPESGNVLRYAGQHSAPFTGQGIAADPQTGGLVGIDRAKKKILFAQPAKE